MNDLISLALILKPAGCAPPDKPLPLWWGRAGHALLLNTIRAADENLAGKLHDEQIPPPITASTLMGRLHEGQLDPQGCYTLRLTSTHAAVSAILLGAIQAGGRLAAGALVELDYQPFTVQAAYTQPGQHPWAATLSYDELAATRLLGGGGLARQIALQFASPLCFKSAGKFMPLPLPGLVFGSLLEKWNANAPLCFPPEAKRFAEECLTVGRFDLHSRRAELKGGAGRLGAVGEVCYNSLNHDRYWMSVMHTLADFALYSGVGVSAAMGLGQCRVLGG